MEIGQTMIYIHKQIGTAYWIVIHIVPVVVLNQSEAWRVFPDLLGSVFIIFLFLAKIDKLLYQSQIENMIDDDMIQDRVALKFFLVHRFA